MKYSSNVLEDDAWSQTQIGYFKITKGCTILYGNENSDSMNWDGRRKQSADFKFSSESKCQDKEEWCLKTVLTYFVQRSKYNHTSRSDQNIWMIWKNKLTKSVMKYHPEGRRDVGGPHK
jgi:hypothetical protein